MLIHIHVQMLSMLIITLRSSGYINNIIIKNYFVLDVYKFRCKIKFIKWKKERNTFQIFLNWQVHTQETKTQSFSHFILWIITLEDVYLQERAFLPPRLSESRKSLYMVKTGGVYPFQSTLTMKCMYNLRLIAIVVRRVKQERRTKNFQYGIAEWRPSIEEWASIPFQLGFR